MKNDILEVEFDHEKGLLTSLVFTKDPERANFIKAGRGLGEIHTTLWYDRENGKFTKKGEEWKLEAFEEKENTATALCLSARTVDGKEGWSLDIRKTATLKPRV